MQPMVYNTKLQFLEDASRVATYRNYPNIVQPKYDIFLNFHDVHKIPHLMAT